MNIFVIIMPNGAALVHPLSALNSKYLELVIIDLEGSTSSSLGLSLKISFRRIECHVQAELDLVVIGLGDSSSFKLGFELEKSIPT